MRVNRLTKTGLGGYFGCYKEGVCSWSNDPLVGTALLQPMNSRSLVNVTPKNELLGARTGNIPVRRGNIPPLFAGRV